MSYPGLTTSQAQLILKKDGLNKLADTSPIKPLEIFLAQFKSILILILLAAAVISFFLSDTIDTIFIVTIVVLNAVFGFAQEFQAEKAIRALKSMVSTTVRVIRDGKEQLIDTKYLVVGDLIILEEGSRIPADCQLLEASGVEVDEASLTGESMPIPKIVDGDTEEAQIFLGTTLVRGHLTAKVIATGSNTEFGKIATLIKSIPDDPTPLQKQLDSLAKTLALAALGATIFIFIIGLWRGQPLFQMLLTSVSLAVAAVPEGLPAILTITLALGVQRMAKRHAIVRKLNAIETLGSTNVICTDKTGTLTKNEMTASHLWLDFKVQKAGDKSNGKLFDALIRAGVLANNATASSKIDSQKLEILGDKTEGALLNLAHLTDYSIDKLRAEGKLIEEFSFDSHAKMMSVIWETNKHLELMSKGAPEIVLEKSISYLNHLGKEIPLTPAKRAKIEEDIATLAAKGERVIALSYRKLKSEKISRTEAEKNLVFLGMVGITDPLREEIKQAISIARDAGIRTIMITGDNPLTAHTIALEAGIIQKNEPVILGDQVEKASEMELRDLVKTNNLFARTTPTDKNRIVEALQSLDFVVAVTGDGVNDAPALKQADVGVAMAITGTDVAKETSDIVLTDDNYATLVTAVEEGRVIYDNILKSLKFLLASNSSELFVILTAVFLGIPLPLTPIQILWINLVTDSLPALALATDPKDPEVMNRLPRTKTTGILRLLDPIFLLKLGLITAFLTTLVFVLVYQTGDLGLARAVSFTTIIILQLLIAFLIRSGQKWHSNKNLLLAIGVILILQVIILSNPALREIFDLTG
jgi:Ca2+-transporting ATPase